MNNNINNQNNQGMNNTFSNNGMNTFTNNMNQSLNQPTVKQPFVDNSVPMNNNPATQQYSQPMNQPTNQKKNLKSLIGIGLLIIAVIIIGVLVVSLTNNDDKNNDSSLNTPTNNNSNEITNNNSNDNTDDDSLDYVALNTYANIAKNVDMKVDSTYVEDKFNFVIRTTFKNNGNKDEILSTQSMGVDVVAYFQAYFVPKNVSVDNYSEEDIILTHCYLRKIVRNNGEEIITSQGDTILYAGETVEGLIYCSITSLHGYAAGVNSLILEAMNTSGSSTYFDIRN